MSTGTITYDPRQRRKTGESVHYGPFALSYSYDYDANGKKRSFTGPDGVTVNYTYDSNNQLATVQLPTRTITVNGYRWTAPSQLTFPGGTTRTQGHDPLLRLTRVEVKDPGQSEVLNHQYTYDGVGNLRTKTTEHGSYTYNYDDLDRLTSAQVPSPLPTETYTYDAVGNRLTDAKTTQTWIYNANNQLNALDGITFDHDANGNTTRKTVAADPTQSRIYVYDTSDRLTEVRDPNNNLIATYTYDPFGRRLWKEVNNTRTYFFYADEGLIAEANGTGTVTKRYGYRPDSTWTTDPLYLKEGGNYYFYQNDHLGTPQKLVSTHGTVVWSARAEAFGLTTVEINSTITNNLRFAGQYYDAETGLYYNWNRYYDPRMGRYLTSDPIGLRGGLNTYLYARANPLRYTDPTGLIGWGGDPFMDDDVTPPPPPPYDNGNYRPGFEPQDQICSPAPWNPIEYHPCAKKCCRAHDACYAKYGCNASSWRGNFTANYGNACQICNIEVMRCVVENAGMLDCGDEPCKK